MEHLKFFTLTLIVCLAYTNGQEDLNKPKVKSLRVMTDIRFHFAVTMVTSELYNRRNEAAEVSFDVTLPNAAFISNFTLEIDGKIYPGKVEEKEKAKKDYEKAKAKGQSAGHVAARPRETNKFNVQVNVAALSSVMFNLTYSEILKRTLGAYEQVTYLDPGQPVEDMKVTINILEARPLKFVHVPPLKNELLTSYDITQSNDIAVITRPTPQSAQIVYKPTWDQQMASSPDGISALFSVRYDIERDYDAGDLLVVNGYFVHFIAPKVQEPISMDIMFVLDQSGSMAGTKIDQLKQAMRVILKDMNEKDRFNILPFSDKAKFWKKNLIRVTQGNIQKGLRYASSLNSGGYTDINQALARGLHALAREKREDALQIVIFLSDGQASAGETNTGRILQNMINVNTMGVPIYSLAFGADADWGLTKKIAFNTGAVARRIYEDSDATLQMTNFYKEVSTTLLADVEVTYLEDHVNLESLTKSSFSNYFEGSELVVAGQLANNIDTMNAVITANSSEGSISLNLERDLKDSATLEPMLTFVDFQSITEKMWAYLTIKEMVKTMDQTENPSLKESLKAKATELSLKYSFVTPLTSMVVTKPDEESVGDFLEDDPIQQNAPVASRSGGGGGGRGRGSGGGTSYGGGDPHFIISMDNLPYPVCFDMRGQNKKAYNLLKDPLSGLTVNMKLGKGYTLNKKGKIRLYMTEVVIYQADLLIKITMKGMFINGNEINWDSKAQVNLKNVSMVVDGLHFRVIFHCGVEVKVSKTIRHLMKPMRADFLNVEIENEKLSSAKTTGIVGQFAHKHFILEEREHKRKGFAFKVYNMEKGQICGWGKGHRRIKEDLLTNEIKTCIVMSHNDHLFQNSKNAFMIPDIYH